ncbi:MAG: HigA family addiction module antidote protein [Candidatus Kerfeldbacteria bacterium]|nr:HigA family addiction module antidote protein [Candidatus Kerfeldbacteria bacterium]
MAKKIRPVHPGEVLLEEFLTPFAISQYRLAKDIAVPPRRINEIIHGTRAISADTALRLGKYFKTSPQFWLNLQTHFDLAVEGEELSSILRNKVKTLEFAT